MNAVPAALPPRRSISFKVKPIFRGFRAVYTVVGRVPAQPGGPSRGRSGTQA